MIYPARETKESLPCETDTIVAVSCARGRSLRGIVRMSGEDSLPLASSIFRPKTDLPSASTYVSLRGEIELPPMESGKCVPFGKLPALLYLMRAPYSYTRQDVVEFHTVGSPAVLAWVLEALLRGGGRSARPGEFTMRAYLSGRIDLAQAEAVLKVVKSRSQAERTIAMGELEGSLSREMRSLREEVVSLVSLVELGIDFSDQDIEVLQEGVVRKRLSHLVEKVARLLRQGNSMVSYDEGIVAALMGRTSVGKSSLANALLGRPLSLVEEDPATTRDPLEGRLLLDPILFSLWDTAGLREPESATETKAQAKSACVERQAQVVLFVVDGSIPSREEDRRLFEEISDRPHIVVVNKMDLGLAQARGDLARKFRNSRIVFTSAVTGEGLSELKRALVEVIHRGEAVLSATKFSLNVRQRLALEESFRHLQSAEEEAREVKREEILALELRLALEAISDFAGRVESEEVLNRIFSEFCIGK